MYYIELQYSSILNGYIFKNIFGIATSLKHITEI